MAYNQGNYSDDSPQPNRQTFASAYSDDSRRGSLVDPHSAARPLHPDEMYASHSHPTVPGPENFGAYAYRQDNGDHGALGFSEPGSPVLGPQDELDQNSNDSNSSGDRTKVDSHSPGGYRMKPAGGVGGSDYGHYPVRSHRLALPSFAT